METGNKYTNISSPWYHNYRAIIFWLLRKKDGEWEKTQRLKRVQWPSLCTSTSILPSSSFLCWLGSVCCSDLLENETKDFFFMMESERPDEGGSDETRPCGLLTVLQGWAVSGNVLPTLCHRYQHTPKRPSLILTHLPGRGRWMNSRKITARRRKLRGIWRRRWLPALCRTLPTRSLPLEESCGQCYKKK